MKRKGSALIFVTTLSSLLLLVAIAASVNSVSDMNITSEEKIRTDLEFACKSGLNRAKTKIEQSFNNDNLNILEPFVTFQGNDADDTTLTPDEKKFNDESFNSFGPDYYSFNINSNGGNKTIYVQYAITNDRANNNGWLRDSEDTTNKIKIEAIAYSPGYGWVGMTENIFAQRRNLFKYQIFFENDLEILPGPNFNLKGLIHTNENMYLNSESAMNIYTDSLTAAGSINRGRLDSNAINGTVKISSEDQDGTLETMASGDDSSNDQWETLAKETWQGTVKDSKLGATRLEAPKLKSFEPNGYYSQNAGININVKNNSGTITYDIKYNGSTHTYTSAQLNGALAEKTIYDYREYPSGSVPKNNTPTKVTNVDINKLKTALGYYPDNGLIYMTRNDAVADNDGDQYTPDPNRVVNGFKIVNGSTLPAAMTLVSNQPVYVQGDFNKHTSTDPAVDTWKPCAVIADAINLLSNSWSDTKSNWKNTAVNPSGTLPAASNTQYNMVLITGNVPTKYGQYSGGLENFPRFLENWSGKTVDITGGFIQLFRSKYATGKWGGSYYSAPTRDWKSEDRFSDLNNLPPGFTDMFPSTAIGITTSDWKQISKDEAELVATEQ
jgi:hypothetical protein